jgi:AcrR family transcriptional regulator
VSRSHDPERKPALLAEILELLDNRPLSSVTFRSLADALAVSTFTLVYHFGSRAQLMREIVAAIAAEQRKAEEAVASPEVSLDTHMRELRAAFAWMLDPDNLKYQRLEFEIAMAEALDLDNVTGSREIYAYWAGETAKNLIKLGLTEADAALESRMLVNLFYGFQFDLVLNGDRRAVIQGGERVLELYLRHIEMLISSTVSPTPLRESTHGQPGEPAPRDARLRPRREGPTRKPSRHHPGLLSSPWVRRN